MPPLIFNSLVSPDPDIRAKTLEQCSRTLAVLRNLQRVAQKNSKCVSFLTFLVFPGLQWVLEILGRLEEEEFVSLGFGLWEDLEDYRRSMKSSLVNEEGFGMIRRRERANLNGRMAPAAAFHTFSASELLQDHGSLPPHRSLPPRRTAVLHRPTALYLAQ